tara:strand:- start:40725 stop:41117 length:393 start_codon:yes stop_codon:yes gene_type:complete
MKKTGIVMGALILMLGTIFSANIMAQGDTASDVDYFADNWEVMLMGTPSGDVSMIFHLTREDGKLKGEITNEYNDDVAEIESIVEREDSITFYWTAEGHYINVDFKIVDENSMTGSLMGMFNATADRVVE